MQKVVGTWLHYDGVFETATGTHCLLLREKILKLLSRDGLGSKPVRDIQYNREYEFCEVASSSASKPIFLYDENRKFL